MKKMQLYGKINATLHDGKTIKVRVYKSGSAVELRFSNPNSGYPDSILVHPMNAGTPEGWMHEISVQRGINLSVVKWEWE